jgi:hypothetical protein
LAVISSGDLAIFLGPGLGSLTDPFFFVPVIVTGLIATKWWHSLVAIGLAVLAYRTIFTVSRIEHTRGWEIMGGIGAFLVGLLLVMLLSGCRDFFWRRSSTSKV